MPRMKDQSKLLAKGWWIAPSLVFGLFIIGCAIVAQVSELGRELLAKSFMTIAGYLATPFILETSAAITGFILVLTYNEWRRSKEGPDWVEMEVKDEESAPTDVANSDKEAVKHA
jgi:hypothetical protein